MITPRVPRLEKLSLYVVGLILFYSVINGYAFVPDLVKSFEFVVFTIALSTLLGIVSPLRIKRNHVAILRVLGGIQDIEAWQTGSMK